MKPSTQIKVAGKFINLRRALEALVPYATHRLTCDASRGDRKPCTCGLAAVLAQAQRLCTPHTPPADYTPRRYG